MTKTKFTVYIATSLDGFIARTDGRLDWLEGSDSGDRDEAGVDTDDMGFGEFIESVDTLVMGRNTYEFVASSGIWAYGDTRLVVLSTTLGADTELPEHLAGKVEFVSMEPVALASKLANEGSKHVYVDGGATIQRYLRAGLIDELILTRVPVLLGSGISLFGELDADVVLRHVSTEGFANGMVQSRYVVER
jgi:dihydrofolate reductase